MQATAQELDELISTANTLSLTCLDDVLYYAQHWPVMLPGLQRIVDIKRRFLKFMPDYRNCIPSKTG